MNYSRSIDLTVKPILSVEPRPKQPLRPEEEDLQDQFENYHYEKPLDPDEFSVSRGWWYRCRYCDGFTKVHTRHPYCRHCGFSPSTTIKGVKE